MKVHRVEAYGGTSSDNAATFPAGSTIIFRLPREKVDFRTLAVNFFLPNQPGFIDRDTETMIQSLKVWVNDTLVTNISSNYFHLIRVLCDYDQSFSEYTQRTAISNSILPMNLAPVETRTTGYQMAFTKWIGFLGDVGIVDLKHMDVRIEITTVATSSSAATPSLTGVYLTIQSAPSTAVAPSTLDFSVWQVQPFTNTSYNTMSDMYVSLRNPDMCLATIYNASSGADATRVLLKHDGTYAQTYQFQIDNKQSREGADAVIAEGLYDMRRLFPNKIFAWALSNQQTTSTNTTHPGLWAQDYFCVGVPIEKPNNTHTMHVMFKTNDSQNRPQAITVFMFARGKGLLTTDASTRTTSVVF